MRYLVRVILFYIFALWLTSEIFPGFAVEKPWTVTVTSGAILALLMTFIKPLLKILLIPINILTLGMANWLLNVLVIYLLTVLVRQVSVASWYFGGASFGGFVIPPAEISYLVSLIGASFIISVIVNILHWASEK